ncbi:MAG: hypothetical protein H6577_23690 [Lewinellaceae bacterium]|nr:hypothetical protein [Saprospiraceae bacterium]MCB9341141.1 hypothetical protein [Lewinellaceae bacterium]
MAEFKRFPPDKYPIELHLSFSRRDADLVQEMKSVLDNQTREESKYRKTIAKHVGNTITMRCYFKDVDALRPVAWKLKDQNLRKDTLQYESTKVTPRMLIEKAESILNKEMSVSI